MKKIEYKHFISMLIDVLLFTIRQDAVYNRIIIRHWGKNI